jgi:hypothetical protein
VDTEQLAVGEPPVNVEVREPGIDKLPARDHPVVHARDLGDYHLLHPVLTSHIEV